MTSPASFTRRVAASFTATVAITVLVGLVSVMAVFQAVRAGDQLAEEDYRRMLIVERLHTEVEAESASARALLLTGNPRFQREAQEYRARARRSMDELARSVDPTMSGDDRRRIEAVLQAEAAHERALERLLATREPAPTATLAQRFEAEVLPHLDRLATDLDGLTRQERARVDAAREAADRAARRTLVLIVGSSTGAVLLAASLGVVLTRTLSRSYEEARRSSREKDEFLAMLGHELRNPLGSISNSVGVLRRRCACDEAATKHHGIIDRQVQLLTHMVNDLLDVSRLRASAVALRRQPVDLGGVVIRCGEACRLAAEARGHRLTITVPDRPVVVDGDADRLEQVVGNLLHNAIKYTPEHGTITVEVRTAGDEAVLTVSDDGVGMEADLIPRVFDQFAQAQRTLDRATGGLGLGLTLVRRLVEMHGGSVHAASPGPGRGSTFEARLPCCSSPLPAVAVPPPAPTPADASWHVLLVEDNADARTGLRELLELEGLRVDEAEDGPRGVELALALRPDVALVDIGLPGMDGYQVAREVRRALGPRGIRLVALTGYGQEEDRRRSLDAGFDDHLVKPVDPDSLVHILKGTGPARADRTA